MDVSISLRLCYVSLCLGIFLCVCGAFLSVRGAFLSVCLCLNIQADVSAGLLTSDCVSAVSMCTCICR